MRHQHLLVAASALLIGLGGTNYAFANNPDPQDLESKTTNALAASVQAGEVEGAYVEGNLSTNTINGNSFSNAKGMFNVQQNGGANSLQQSDNTLGAILGCTCTDTAEHTSAGAFALSAQVASVDGGKSIGAVNTSESKSNTEKSASVHYETNAGAFTSTHSGSHSDSSTSNSSNNGDKNTSTSSYNSVNNGSGGNTAGTGKLSTSTDTDSGSGSSSESGHFSSTEASAHFDTEAWHSLETTTAVASTNGINNAFSGAVGMFNVSQNVGNNSMQQASNTAAAIIAK